MQLPNCSNNFTVTILIMSQTQCKNVNSLQMIDSPVSSRVSCWQKKKYRGSSTSSCINSSKEMKTLSASTLNSTKIPIEGWASDRHRGNPVIKKSPKKSISTLNKPVRTLGGDRFIPSRTTSNFELAHYKLTQDENDQTNSPARKELQRVMSHNLHGYDVNMQRIFSYKYKDPSVPERFQNSMRDIYTQAKAPAPTKSSRHIPQAPDRILDAPDIVDDYYLNLIDWGANNLVAAALGARVYLWNAGTGDIDELLELGGNDYVSSLSWAQDGTSLAVGHTNGTVELWDCERSKKLRTMEGHSARVGSLSWNSFVLSSGCRSGQIIHHDVRQRKHNIATLSGHSQEVCGLKWSPDGKYLASGGNDNVLNIWQAVNGVRRNTTPLHSFTAHQAAVKALAWCPWQPHVLASGGGTADSYIRLWNCNSGSCVNAMKTRSQVSALLWSSIYKELVSGHGVDSNQITIWKYPGMKKVTQLTGHTERVLDLAISPDGSTLLSAGADETLRLWKCFTKSPTETKEAERRRAKPSALRQTIR